MGKEEEEGVEMIPGIEISVYDFTRNVFEEHDLTQFFMSVFCGLYILY